MARKIDPENTMNLAKKTILTNGIVSLLCLLLLSIISCTKESGLATENNTPSATTAKLESGVFIAGIMDGGKVWNATQDLALSESDAAYSIYVSGQDIYVAGTKDKLTSGRQTNGSCDGACTFSTVAKYWKNGVGVELTDPMKGAAEANSIFVADKDVYVAGKQFSPYMYEGHGGNSFALLWKNGVADTLTDGTRNAEARSVFVSGSDVYVCGQDGDQYITATAKYWKNGAVVNLTDGQRGAAATSIAVSGNDVYVAGFEGNTLYSVAKYWKNGVAVNLTDGTHWAEARSIFISGTDVYVAGFDNLSAVYWKNGEKIIISADDGTIATAESIFVSGNNNYILVNNTLNGAFLWKNGAVAYAFPLNPELSPWVTLKSIFVVPDGVPVGPH